MKFKFNNKFCLFFTALVSVFAVVVAGISTLARFQQTTTLSNASNKTKETPPVQSGSTDLTINSVKGYKYTYDENGEGETDYNSGHITTYGDVQGSSTNVNENQGKTTSFDVPTEGIGYYIVGNEKWCETQNFDTGATRKYSASIRMEDDNSDNTLNYAYITDLNLYEGSEIKIRHHYIANSGSDIGKTKDEWITSSIENSNYEHAQVKGGNIVINTTGVYNLYLKKDTLAVFFNKQNVQQNGKIKPTKKNSLTKRNAAGDNTFVDLSLISGNYTFLNPGVWDTDNARFAAYFFGDNGNKWVKMERVTNQNYYYALNDDLYPSVNFVRMDKDKTDLSRDSKWNQTSNVSFDLDGENYLGNCYDITGWGNNGGDSPGNWGSEKMLSYDPRTSFDNSKDGYYIVGEGIGIGDTSSRSKGVKLNTSNLIDSEHNLAELQNVHFNSASTFKVCTVKNGKILTPYSGYHSNIIQPTSELSTFIIDGLSQGDNITTKIEFTADLYFNKQNEIYLYVPRTITLNYKIVAYDGTIGANWIPLDPIEVSYNSSYTAPTSLNIPGYTWNEKKWYENEDFTGEFTTGNIENNKTLYTKLDENSFDITLQLVYTTEEAGGTGLSQYTRRSNGSNTTFKTSESSTITIANLDTNSSTLKLGADAKYTFSGYYENLTSNTISGQISSSKLGGQISGRTIYVVFQPKGPHTLYRRKSYFVYQNNTYSSFTTLDSSLAAATYTNVSIDTSSSIYDTQTLGVPSSLNNEYKVLSNFNSSSNLSGMYKFVFDGWFIGTSSGCDFSNAYTTPAYQTADVYLYARMKYVPADHMTLFVDAKTPSWSRVSSHLWYNIGSGDQSLGDIELTKVFSSGTIFKMHIPTDDTNAYFNFCNTTVGTSPTGTDKTCDLGSACKGANTSSPYSFNQDRGSLNMVTIWDTQQLYYGSRRWNWSVFYKEATGGDGFYIVGALSKDSTYHWTFDSAIKLESYTDPNMPNARYRSKELTSKEIEGKFKIWEYTSAAGKGIEYNYTQLNSDSETMGIVDATASQNDGNNIVISNDISGNKFYIYLIQPDGTSGKEDYKVRIVDKEKNGTLFTYQQLENYGTKSFTLGYGDFDISSNRGSRIAIYEKGLHITQNDITNSGIGGIEFAMRCKYQGSYHRYYYDDGKGTNGLDKSYPEVSGGSTARSYGDGDTLIYGRYKDCVSFKITQPGYYNFYVLENGTISIATIPGEYGDGFYICDAGPTTSEDSTANTESWDGVKMKTIEGNADNVAVYTCYVAKDTDPVSTKNIYIKSYSSGVDGGVIKQHGSMSANNVALANMNTTTGIISFVHPGVYNIFVYRSGNEYSVSIALYSKESFYKMNPISNNASSATKVKNSFTSIVIEVDFTVTYDSSLDMSALVEMVKDTSVSDGLSNYVVFDYVVDPNLNGSTCYDYMRSYHYDNPAGKIDYANQALNKLSSSHKLYIIIDYDPHKVAGIKHEIIPNDFFFVVSARQLEA